MKASIVYYTDNFPREELLSACRRRLLASLPDGCDLVSVSQRPIVLGRNFVLPIGRSVLSMYRQVLKGLEECRAEAVFLVEHDLLYHPTHFAFELPDSKHYWYDHHRWCVDADTGRAVFYHSDVPSLLCADRNLLIRHFDRKVSYVSQHGHKSSLGFSPPKGLPKELQFGEQAKTWMADHPSIDIRHGESFTRRRMDKSQFRSEMACRGWIESDSVPGWGVTFGRFREFIGEHCGG